MRNSRVRPAHASARSLFSLGSRVSRSLRPRRTLSGERPTALARATKSLISMKKALVTKCAGYSHPPYSAHFSYYGIADCTALLRKPKLDSRKRLLARLTALPTRRQRPEQSIDRRAKEAVGTHLATSVSDRTLRPRSLGPDCSDVLRLALDKMAAAGRKTHAAVALGGIEASVLEMDVSQVDRRATTADHAPDCRRTHRDVR